jgi:hypothetical protein
MRSPAGRQAPPRRNPPQIPGSSLPSVSRPPIRSSTHENAPSRWRLRPAFRLTSAEAIACRRAIDLGRSVLGAVRTLGAAPTFVKTAASRLVAICGVFFSHRVRLRMVVCALAAEEKKEAPARTPAGMSRRLDGGSRERKCRLCRRRSGKSSPSRERFRPPSRRTFRFRVVLLGGLRPTGAPCSAQAKI